MFIRAYEHFEQLRSSPAAGGWLKTVTTNLSLNYLTRYRRRWRLFSEMTTDAAEEDSPAMQLPLPDRLLENLGEEQQRAAIDEALRRLPEHQRVPLVLYHFEDLSYQEIAATPASLARQGQDRHPPRPRRDAAHAEVRRSRRR